MGLFDDIGNFFGNFFGFGGGGGGGSYGGYGISGDHAIVPGSMIDGKYRPVSPSGQGVYMDTSSQLIRAWESRGWIPDDGFIAELQQIDQEAKKAAANSGKAEKVLGSIVKSEGKIVKHATSAIGKVAKGTAQQYGHNEKLMTALDGVAADMAVAYASRDMEIAKAREQLTVRIQQRRQSIRGNGSMGLSMPGQRQPARFGQRVG